MTKVGMSFPSQVLWYFLHSSTYFIAIYLQMAKESVRQIEAVCSICAKCMWNSKYTAHEYGKSNVSGKTWNKGG